MLYDAGKTCGQVSRTKLLQGIGFGSKKASQLIGGIPLVKEGPVDELLQENGAKLDKSATKMIESILVAFSEMSSPRIGVFTDKMDDMIQIYNHTEAICFDKERLYLVGKGLLHALIYSYSIEGGRIMDIGKTALDLIKNENMQNKSINLLSMIFPYAAIEKKAVDMYIDEIEKSDLPLDTKMIAVLNAKTTLKKLKNQSKIIQIADMNINQNNSTVDPSKVNEEWLDRFMDSAGYVSSEEMQVIWAKILANEFERPGSTPPNMIRILSEITPELARAFRKVCSMKVLLCPLLDDEIIKDEEEVEVLVPYSDNHKALRDMGLSFNTLSELETLGIIKFSSMGYILNIKETDKALLYVGEKLEVVTGYEKGAFPIGNVMLTVAGEALSEITEEDNIPSYGELAIEYLKNAGVGFENAHNFQVIETEDCIEFKKKTT